MHKYSFSKKRRNRSLPMSAKRGPEGAFEGDFLHTEANNTVFLEEKGMSAGCFEPVLMRKYSFLGGRECIEVCFAPIVGAEI
jgi:hypothetical protein